MAELKTKPTGVSPVDYIQSLDNQTRVKDGMELLEMMTEISGHQPRMWGPSIIGYGDYRYKYATGREGDWFEIGFSPRKASLSLYISGCHNDDPLLDRLGKHKRGAGCLYVNKLDDIDRKVLRDLIRSSLKKIREKS